MLSNFLKRYAFQLQTLFILLLAGAVRLTDLGVFSAIDEEDRWRWAVQFFHALLAGNLPGTLVGDGYPGIFPAWLETIWLFAAVGYHALTSGGWPDAAGIDLLLKTWGQTDHLVFQRLPVVFVNVLLVVIIFSYLKRLFGAKTAFLAGIFISLDPFLLSDSRLNRAEALLAQLMFISLLALLLHLRDKNPRHLFLSILFGGFACLTKLQALLLLPMLGAISLIWLVKDNPAYRRFLPAWIKLIAAWTVGVGLVFALLWPAVWIVPADTFALMANFLTRKVGEEGVKLFFLGKTVLDDDPGWLFYPVIFILRVAPLTLIGLAVGGIQLIGYIRPKMGRAWQTWFDPAGLWGLAAYVVLYLAGMSAGGHKQDRFLLVVFPVLNVLAAAAYVRLAHRFHLPAAKMGLAALVLLALQLATALPYHPYYFHYFNPLAGGGQTAVKLTRIGWGEGMDQVGAYLAAKPGSEHLLVGSKFTRNLLHFPGELVSLAQNGRWTKADYIVLYIQQAQRAVEPDPGFVHYFKKLPAEKVIRLGDIDYAWIYPSPFDVPANPQVSLIPGQASLLGFRLDDDDPAGPARLIYQNLQSPPAQPWQARLVGPADTGWIACPADPAFAEQALASGEIAESVCPFAWAGLPPGVYSLEVSAAGTPILFPEAKFALTVSPAGGAAVTPEAERLRLAVVQIAPPAAVFVDRLYDDRLKLAAFALEPPQPLPGEALTVTLYWQAVRDGAFASREEIESVQTDPETAEAAPVRLTVKLADSRLLALGLATAEPELERQWGEVFTTSHHFDLSAGLVGPLAAQVEVELTNEAGALINATTADHQPLSSPVGRFTVAPEDWPAPVSSPAAQRWQNGIALSGYTISPEQIKAGEAVQVNLYWHTTQAISRSYAVFIHLIDAGGQIKAQSDGLPLAGAYPTDWWLPGKVIADPHSLVLPPDLSPGGYQLVVGLYEPDTGERLQILDEAGDSFSLQSIAVQVK